MSLIFELKRRNVIRMAEAQAVLDGYLRDPKLLPELRFWVAN